VMGAGTCDGCPTAGDKRFRRGDANCDGQFPLDLSDPIFIISYLFVSGPSPVRMDAADANDDAKVDISDSIKLLSWLFLGAAKPPKPFEYRGLDPTPDDLNGSCDLQPGRFQEFNCFTGEKDVDGDGLPDGIYIDPNQSPSTIMFGTPGDFQETVFHTFPAGVTANQLAVGEGRVVYVQANERKIYPLKDTDGNGLADVISPFALPQTLDPPLDAVLADSDSGQSVVTLHASNSRETLVISNDAIPDPHGMADAGNQRIISSQVLESPRGLAVVAGTGRVFVSGTWAGGLEWTMVVFYEDTEGDKVVNAAQSEYYIATLHEAESYDSLAFVPETRDLLTLSHPPAGGSKVLCARDPEDFYFAPSSETEFVPAILLPSSATIVDGFYRPARPEAGAPDPLLRVQVTDSDQWRVWEIDDYNLDCSYDLVPLSYVKADVALAEAQETDMELPEPPDPPRTFCRLRTDAALPYGLVECVNFGPPPPGCNTNGTQFLTGTLNTWAMYACNDFPPTSSAEASWIPQGPAPPHFVTVDVQPPPPPGVLVFVWVEGKTDWTVSKVGNCCGEGINCRIDSTYTLNSLVHFDGLVPPCGFNLPILNNEVVTVCKETKNGSKGIDTKQCAKQVGHTQRLRLNMKNRMDVVRVETNHCSFGQDSESASMKTQIRPRCSVVDPNP